MPDLIVWAAAGVALVLAGTVLLLIVGCRRGRHAPGGQLGTQAWDTHVPPPAADLAPPEAPTELIPAVQPDQPTELLAPVPADPPGRGRHYYPGEAEDTGAIPRHGWRPGERRVIEP